MKSKKMTFLVTVFLCILQNTTIKSQVTIGSTYRPVIGSLLQLKETDDELTNSTKGLGLPRVSLTDKNKLYPMLAGVNDYDDGSNASLYEDENTGLLVYNIATDPRPECEELSNGIYVWNGTTWLPLRESKSTLPSTENFDAATGILTDRSGYTYYTANFGTAGRWMTQNLRTTHAATCDGTIYIYKGNESLTEAHYYYPGTQVSDPINEEELKKWDPKLGLLYNWYAATNGANPSTGDQAQIPGATIGNNEIDFHATTGKRSVLQGICPTGWHLPSDREWNELEKELQQEAKKYADAGITDEAWVDNWDTTRDFRGNHGKTMKSKDRVLNGAYETYGYSKPYDAATQSDRGFDVFLTGDVNKKVPSNYGRYAYFWTSSSYGSGIAMHRYVKSMDGGNTKEHGVFRTSLEQSVLLSIRCKQNTTNDIVIESENP